METAVTVPAQSCTLSKSSIVIIASSLFFRIFYLELYRRSIRCASPLPLECLYCGVLRVLFSVEQRKAEADEHDGGAPQERKRVIERRQRGVLPENGADPDDVEHARAQHRAERRIQRVSAAAQDASWYFIQITERLIEQNAQDSYPGASDDRGVRRKQSEENIPEQDDRGNRHGAAHGGQAQTQP